MQAYRILKRLEKRGDIKRLTGSTKGVKYGESGTLVQRQLINTRDSFSIIFRIAIRLFFGGSYSLLLLVKRRKGCI
jgi:sugar-specific transcriptional regulator TrmB